MSQLFDRKFEASLKSEARQRHGSSINWQRKLNSDSIWSFISAALMVMIVPWLFAEGAEQAGLAEPDCHTLFFGVLASALLLNSYFLSQQLWSREKFSVYYHLPLEKEVYYTLAKQQAVSLFGFFLVTNATIFSWQSVVDRFNFSWLNLIVFSLAISLLQFGIALVCLRLLRGKLTEKVVWGVIITATGSAIVLLFWAWIVKLFSLQGGSIQTVYQKLIDFSTQLINYLPSGQWLSLGTGSDLNLRDFQEPTIWTLTLLLAGLSFIPWLKQAFLSEFDPNSPSADLDHDWDDDEYLDEDDEDRDSEFFTSEADQKSLNTPSEYLATLRKWNRENRMFPKRDFESKGWIESFILSRLNQTDKVTLNSVSLAEYDFTKKWYTGWYWLAGTILLITLWNRFDLPFPYFLGIIGLFIVLLTVVAKFLGFPIRSAGDCAHLPIRPIDKYRLLSKINTIRLLLFLPAIILAGFVLSKACSISAEWCILNPALLAILYGTQLSFLMISEPNKCANPAAKAGRITLLLIAVLLWPALISQFFIPINGVSMLYLTPLIIAVIIGLNYGLSRLMIAMQNRGLIVAEHQSYEKQLEAE